MKPEEITASDMPWAVAWYADRRGGLAARKLVRAYHRSDDYDIFGAPVNASLSHAHQRQPE